jgi:KDO2-lipid IV(A) lauroyltransferase
MDYKKIRKSIGRFGGYLGLSFSSLIIKAVPDQWLYIFAQAMSGIGYRVARKQRRIALESLEIAFGSELSPAERKKIARDCFVFLAKAGVELAAFMDRPKLLKGRIGFEGKDNLDNALKKGNGVILVSAHFGNFPLMLARLSLEGYKTAGIMRPMRDSRVEKMFLEKRNKLNVKTIYSQPRKTCVDESIRSLRNNELIFIPIDQNFGSAGVFVDFFGQKAATATGPVVLARRTKASIIPCFIVRQKDDTHKIIFEKPILISEGKDEQETILINIQKLTDVIELYIRRYPAEWGWIHRRWKSKPN